MHRENEDVILLFGMPRSGTTWIGKTFDSHPGVAYRHEPDSQFPLNDILPLLPDLKNHQQYKDGLEHYFSNLLPRCSPRTCGKQPRFPKQGDSALSRQSSQLLILTAKVIEKALGRAVSWPAKPRGRLIWKSIESVGRLGVILQLYPQSRGILILRDPHGYVASVMRGEASQRFLGTDSIANDWELFSLLCETRYAKESGISLSQIQKESVEKRLSWLWVLYNQKALDDIKGLPNGTIVRYEDLCATPEQTYRNLFDFCGLSWNQQTRDFVAASTQGTQASDDYYSVYKHPLESANKWRKELSDSQAAAITETIAPHPIGQFYAAESLPRYTDVTEQAT